MSKLPAAVILTLLVALPGCTPAWSDARLSAHAFFQLGLDEAPVLTVPIAELSGAGSSSGSGNASSSAPAAPAPPAPPAGGAGGGSSAPVPAPTPEPAEVLSNTLEAGPGAIEGLVLDVVHGGAPVPGTIVTVVSAADPTKQAVLRNGPDGRYRVAGIALGLYRVLGEKPGHAAGLQAIEVILYPGAPEVTTVNMALYPP